MTDLDQVLTTAAEKYIPNEDELNGDMSTHQFLGCLNAYALHSMASNPDHDRIYDIITMMIDGASKMSRDPNKNVFAHEQNTLNENHFDGYYFDTQELLPKSEKQADLAKRDSMADTISYVNFGYGLNSPIIRLGVCLKTYVDLYTAFLRTEKPEELKESLLIHSALIYKSITSLDNTPDPVFMACLDYQANSE